MKPKILFFIVISFFAQTVFAQSVVITSKKVTYKRPKPTADFKKTFTVNYPKVKASSIALSKKIETSISFEKNLIFSLREEMGEYQWLEEADFSVGYNKKGVLSVGLSVTGTAAHPTWLYKNVVVDLKTGNKISPIDVFTNLNGLIAKIKTIQKEEIKEGIEEIKKDLDYSNENTDELFKYTDFIALNLEGFSIDDKGVTFYYDYGFPYIIRALQPSGNYVFSWKEIKPFIKSGRLFAQFVR